MRSIIYCTIALALAITTTTTSSTTATAFERCHSHCPHCQEACYASVSVENEKKHCWNIECKTVCIPRVTFPWQQCQKDCCDACPQPAKCGRVRTVRVLVKHEYECPKCKYKWSVPETNCCTDASCSAGGCSVPACTAPDAIAPAPAFEYGDPAPLPPNIHGAIETPAEPTNNPSLFQALLHTLNIK
ncbi:MAG: hypothetical protein NXI22_08105 [bacterium]|nr:hypothetical protein [bacterium]